MHWDRKQSFRFSIESNDDNTFIFIELSGSENFPKNTSENLNAAINTEIIQVNILQSDKLQITINNSNS
jgi:hypothetical protein